MKYLKCFEDLSNSDYNKGDYVLLDLDKIRYNNNESGDVDVDENGDPTPFDKYALINEITVELNNGQFLYNVIFYNYNKEINNSYGVQSDEIIRKLNSSEIEVFNRKKDALKYNI